MPIGTPFHARTLALCESLSYRDWAGYYAASSYEPHHEHEYHAIRHAVALIDVSPLFKYRVSGPDALAFVNRVITRDARRIAVGQVFYTPWCDEQGYVIDDGTVARLGEELFRWTAAEPNLRWLTRHGAGLRVTIEDESEQTAALAVQGPMAAQLVRQVVEADVAALRYFRVTGGRVDGVPVDVSRTGYTGDLGYELFMPAAQALRVWDALTSAGVAYAARPAGMLALDVARVEAGLLLADVDFHGSHKATIAAHRYTPFEMGLSRLVSLDKGWFVGGDALRKAHAQPARRRIVGLDVDWTEVETLFDRAGLIPAAPAAASRVAVPVMQGGRQVGRATTTAWSPVLKKLLALATIDAPHCQPGSRLKIEVTVDAVRHAATATVVPTPFFNHPRKTAFPAL